MKVLQKELEQTKVIQQKTSEECEQTTEQQREVEKQMKHAQWEVQDVKAMKDAKIHELEAKLAHEEKATKRLKEDYKRKYVTPFLSLVKLSGSPCTSLDNLEASFHNNCVLEAMFHEPCNKTEAMYFTSRTGFTSLVFVASRMSEEVRPVVDPDSLRLCLRYNTRLN